MQQPQLSRRTRIRRAVFRSEADLHQLAVLFAPIWVMLVGLAVFNEALMWALARPLLDRVMTWGSVGFATGIILFVAWLAAADPNDVPGPDPYAAHLASVYRLLSTAAMIMGMLLVPLGLLGVLLVSSGKTITLVPGFIVLLGGVGLFAWSYWVYNR